MRVKGRNVREREAMLMFLGIGASILLDRNQFATVKLIADYARSSVSRHEQRDVEGADHRSSLANAETNRGRAVKQRLRIQAWLSFGDGCREILRTDF